MSRFRKFGFRLLCGTALCATSAYAGAFSFSEEAAKDAAAEEDRKAHELAEARNQCDGMIHTVKKSLAEYGKELSDSEKASIEAAMKDAEEAIRGSDLDAIKAKSEALGTAAQKLGEKMYAKQQANAAGAEGEAGTAGEPKKDDSDVVDAEFTEVKDKK